MADRNIIYWTTILNRDQDSIVQLGYANLFKMSPFEYSSHPDLCILKLGNCLLSDETLLINAIECGYSDIVEYILNRGLIDPDYDFEPTVCKYLNVLDLLIGRITIQRTILIIGLLMFQHNRRFKTLIAPRSKDLTDMFFGALHGQNIAALKHFDRIGIQVKQRRFLIWAIQIRYLRLVQYFLDIGCSTHEILDIAVRYPQLEIIAYLRSRSIEFADTDRSIRYLIREQRLDILQIVVPGLTFDRKYAVNTASRSGNLSILQYLKNT